MRQARKVYSRVDVQSIQSVQCKVSNTERVQSVSISGERANEDVRGVSLPPTLPPSLPNWPEIGLHPLLLLSFKLAQSVTHYK